MSHHCVILAQHFERYLELRGPGMFELNVDLTVRSFSVADPGWDRQK